MSFTAEDLGFVDDGDGWHKVVGGVTCHFRLLHTYYDVAPVVELQ